MGVTLERKRLVVGFWQKYVNNGLKKVKEIRTCVSENCELQLLNRLIS